ncbi:MAG: hypothetical protein L3J34_12090 [Flavobacteriaceae bacterium]|nr:hypothetical protein [Flavobacteriaceae bacterium]
MKLFKSIITVLLIAVIAVSCKADKKEAETVVEEQIEEVSETTQDDHMEEGHMSSEKMAGEEAVNEEGAEEEVVEEKVVDQGISVVYPKDSKLAKAVDTTIKRLIKDNPSLQSYFNTAKGFVIFPVITKAGLGIGGAGGKGLVFENKKVIGRASLAQATFGLQAGGQQYEEVVFFETNEALDKFKAGKIKFSGQASAVALKKGASIDIAYQNGVAIFTKVKGGIMAEASVGGQKFKYKDGI